MQTQNTEQTNSGLVDLTQIIATCVYDFFPFLPTVSYAFMLQLVLLKCVSCCLDKTTTHLLVFK